MNVSCEYIDEIVLLRQKVREFFKLFNLCSIFFLKNPANIILVRKKLPSFIKIADTEVTLT